VLRIPATTLIDIRAFDQFSEHFWPTRQRNFGLMSNRAIKPRRHRLEVQVTPEQDALIRRAADLEEDTTVTVFVLDTVTLRANRVVQQHRDLVLSNQVMRSQRNAWTPRERSSSLETLVSATSA
jgi:uncharacterized protein (DUF1778 family)